MARPHPETDRPQRVDRQEQRRRKAWQKRLHRPRETVEEIQRRLAYFQQQYWELADLMDEVRAAPIPLSTASNFSR